MMDKAPRSRQAPIARLGRPALRVVRPPDDEPETPAEPVATREPTPAPTAEPRPVATRLRPSSLRVYRYLGGLARTYGPGRVFPSVGGIASKLGLSRRAVQLALAELRQAGMVETVRDKSVAPLRRFIVRSRDRNASAIAPCEPAPDASEIAPSVAPPIAQAIAPCVAPYPLRGDDPSLRSGEELSSLRSESDNGPSIPGEPTDGRTAVVSGGSPEKGLPSEPEAGDGGEVVRFQANGREVTFRRRGKGRPTSKAPGEPQTGPEPREAPEAVLPPENAPAAVLAAPAASPSATATAPPAPDGAEVAAFGRALESVFREHPHYSGRPDAARRDAERIASRVGAFESWKAAVHWLRSGRIADPGGFIVMAARNGVYPQVVRAFENFRALARLDREGRFEREVVAWSFEPAGEQAYFDRVIASAYAARQDTPPSTRPESERIVS